MRLNFKMEYLKKIYQRYHRSSRAEKTQILNEFCEVCKYNRKYAIWLLNESPPSKHKKQRVKVIESMETA
jgi:hypothetical protein